MRIANDSILRPDESTLIPWTSDPVYLGSISDYSVQVKYLTGGATIKLQCSVDLGKQLAQSWSGEGIVNWTDITNSVTSLVEDGDITFDVAEASYRWVRVVVTGTGSITSARFHLKGG